MDVPQTQNTAPVLEFRCLYTQDLRRKQKRWQDGRLKFHTFNKRVMVYDERSNFVGDTHWREDTEFDEGEELELERGGILVEVGECVGKRDQDLFELVDKRVKEREERVAAKMAVSSPSRPHASLLRPTQASPAVGPLQHKPLNAMLAPTGHYGRAVVPHASPFEEKYGLMRGKQDGAENGRPAKRPKQNEDAPSKNGYAQNLMGATLTLASSKPPSTAAIRYEPVIARPSIRETLAPTIDLTGDEDGEERDIAARRIGVREERDSGERWDKGQRRLKRSPARCGYARNLTGASLALSRPEGLSSKRSRKILSTGTSAKAMLQKNNQSSLEIEEDSSVHIESVATRLPAATKPSKEPIQKIPKSPKRNRAFDHRSSSPMCADNIPPVTKMCASKGSTRQKLKPTKDLSAFEDRSSSPTRVDVPALITKPTRNVQRVLIQNSSAMAPTPEQPVSALRIKARPPRKMMMFMNRPSSHPSNTTESSSTGRPRPPENSSFVSNEVALSQATMHLNLFCQRQQEIIQARLSGKRPGLDLEDPISSPEDRGIDHQTIDLLLSRKCLPVEDKAIVGPNQSNPTVQEPESAAQNEQPCLASGLTREDVLEPQPRMTSPFVSESAPDGLRDKDACPRSLKPIANTNCEREKSTSHGSVIQSENSAAAPRAAPTSASEIITVSPTLLTEEKNQQTLPKASQISPTIAKIPEHFSSVIQATTEHFRAMIKSSASSTVQLSDVVPSPRRETDHVEASPLQKDKIALSEVVVKPSPRSSPVGEVSNIGPELFKAAAESDPEKDVGRSFEKAVVPVETTNAPKARLVNPATRGKSLQTIAANTVDSLAPAFSVMPPSPPRITTWPQKNSDRSIAAEERATPGGYVGDRTITGPWSRESYDLFGSWLPPGTGEVTL
jgi:hypothetical protein